MGSKKPDRPPANLTPARAGRLYKLVTFLAAGPSTRPAVLRKLRLDTRGFYRDLAALRGLGLAVNVTDDAKYHLEGTLDDALARFPLPNPDLNVREALQLAHGTGAAQQKLRRRIDAFLKGTPSAKGKKSR